MKNLDRFIALTLTVFFIGYIVLSYDFHLLPFEKHQSFKPNTMPKGIGIIGLVLSVSVLLTAQGSENADNKHWKTYDYKRYIGMIALMAIYATFLKPAGFVISTTLFLILGAIILGERHYLKLSIVALVSATIIWIIVDRLLGIYLYPIPEFLQPLFN